ncbi:MAG: permease [Alphaproteobacteria bacterium]|nr:permease [Alphaproteobacteria bacterium]
MGVSKTKRRYDLPLEKGAGGLFLKLLIGMMSILAVLALAASFVLSAMTERWTSGLENRASIEIPAQDQNGKLLSTTEVEALVKEVEQFLKKHPAVLDIQVMSKEEITSLVSPWLGEDMTYDQIPLPGLISLRFREDVIFKPESLQVPLKNIAPQIRLDTHQAWLSQLLRFTGSLNFAALIVTFTIGITTIIAVAGAVQARMAIYHEELELLHLMGAGDRYISSQLQRYMFLTAFQGAIIGALIGGILLLLMGWISGKMDITLLPDFSLSAVQIISLCALPLLVGMLAMFTARYTVIQTLSKMP